jgi:hypothetical protein
MRQTRLSRHMVATQQVRKNMVWGQTRNDLRVWLIERGGYVYAKASKYLSGLQLLEHQNIDHPQSPLQGSTWLTDPPTPTDRLVQLPTQGSSNHVRIHAAHDREHDCQDNFLHSIEVVHISHESWPSWIVRYSLYKWALLHTCGVCTRTSLQGSSTVSSSL